MNTRGRSALVAAGVFGHPDRERLALDISSLKQQYARLRERQRQAHIILAAACARQPHGNYTIMICNFILTFFKNI